MLLDALRQWVDEHGLLPACSSGVVAFSGGADSLALLHLLEQLASERELQLRAVHVDHALRSGSAEQATRARDLALEMGVPCVVRRAAELAGAGSNLQERARRARLSILREEAGDGWVALGHTADDQVETVLMRLLRGAGSKGLSGMAPRRGQLVRPLLGSWRGEIEEHLRSHQLAPLVDPSNTDRRFFRNRVRHEILPVLSRENPAVGGAIWRLAANCRAEDAALERAASQLRDESLEDDGRLRLDALRDQPEALLYRVLARSYEEATGSRRRLQRGHLLQLAELARGRAGSRGVDLPGCRVERRYDQLLFRPPSIEGRPKEVGAVQPARAARARVIEPLEAVEASGPGRWELADGRALELLPTRATGALHELPADKLRFPLVIRGPQAGDRIAIAQQRTKKVSRVLIDRKVEAALRPQTPLVVAGGRVLLVMGLRRAAGWAPQKGEPAVLFRLRS